MEKMSHGRTTKRCIVVRLEDITTRLTLKGILLHFRSYIITPKKIYACIQEKYLLVL